MKRRNFVKAASLTTLAASGASLASASANLEEKQQIYEWRVYTMQFGGSGGALHKYFSSALLPALKRQGIKNVGAFREVGAPMPTKAYLLIPYDSLQQMAEVGEKLAQDEAYQKAKADYDGVPSERPVYDRYDVYLLKAFSGIPQMKLPTSEKRIFELRTYEGYSEDAVRRKVKMFNAGELDIFYKTNLNPVFFGHIMAGPKMPALVYMLWFEDMEERDKNWSAFINHPDWKKMSGMKEYANSVSNILRVFLEPTDYSQV